MSTYQLVLCLLLTTISSICLAAEPKKMNDESIIVSTRPRISEKVQNGIVYDKATIAIADISKLIVPENAQIVLDETAKEITIAMEKTLGFAGHPPKPITLEHVRQYMGCATKTVDKTQHIVTFGEWDTRKEGSATMRLLIIVPKAMEIETKKEYAGPDSIANTVDATTQNNKIPEGYWYAVIAPHKDWTPVKQIPDPSRQAAPKGK